MLAACIAGPAGAQPSCFLSGTYWEIVLPGLCQTGTLCSQPDPIGLLMGTHTITCKHELDLYMIQGSPLVDSLSKTVAAAEVFS